MGNTAGRSVCCWESQQTALLLRQGQTAEDSQRAEEQSVFPSWTQVATLTEHWLPGPLLGSAFLPCEKWCGGRAQVLETHFKTLVALTAPENWGLLCCGKIKSHPEQNRWPFLQRAKKPRQSHHGGLQPWQWQETDVWAAVFPMCIVSGRFFPPYSKCNKQKYCLKSIIEHMSSILFTNILFVLFSPPLI